jgi:hypothetical protein
MLCLFDSWGRILNDYLEADLKEFCFEASFFIFWAIFFVQWGFLVLSKDDLTSILGFYLGDSKSQKYGLTSLVEMGWSFGFNISFEEETFDIASSDIITGIDYIEFCLLIIPCDWISCFWTPMENNG